jgi:hypothetical protein
MRAAPDYKWASRINGPAAIGRGSAVNKQLTKGLQIVKDSTQD